MSDSWCKDCRWFTHSPHFCCVHPDGSERSVMYGHVIGIQPWKARDENGFCGPKAKFFEPRPPSWWERLFG